MPLSGASSISARRTHLHSLPDSNHPADVSAILRELVSHASRTEWCNMRRYSAFAACVCDVYVCECEPCGLFRDFVGPRGSRLFVLTIIIRTLWRYGVDGLLALQVAVVGLQCRSV